MVRGQSRMPLGLQLGHGGRKASQHRPWEEGGRMLPPDQGGWLPVAPSPVPYNEGDTPPEALDGAGLERIRSAFGSAARRAAAMGFDLVEVHAAHGYLLHQFLSPLSNRRVDAYGGSLENRLRFPLEIVDTVRRSFGGPVGVRISGSDWVAGGWALRESSAFAQELKRRNCVYIHVSGGGLSPLQRVAVGPGYQVSMAADIRKETGSPVIAVGLITGVEQAESIVASGQADMVALGRGMLYNPRWPWHAAARLGVNVEAPPQYWRSQPHGVKDLFT
jgi:2,4-dienoyl-CoA reductase-like NADH-dependent reductase (Old Yellow Enzyme family)